MNVSNRPLSIVQAYTGRPEATMRTYIEMDEGGGPRFWTSGALYPLGIAVDHPSITGHPEVFGLSSDIVEMYTRNEMAANRAGYELNMKNDTFNQVGRRQGYRRNPIPGFLDLEPRTWPPQEYLTRWLSARDDVSAADVDDCTDLQSQLDLMCTVHGWNAAYDSGVLARPFDNASQHVMQLQFYGIEASKVSCFCLPLYCHRCVSVPFHT